jgi:hypothetical protein
MKFATNPRRRSDAATRRSPVRAVNVAVAVISRPGSPSGTVVPSCAARRIASVVVELTFRTREVPRNE